MTTALSVIALVLSLLVVAVCAGLVVLLKGLRDQAEQLVAKVEALTPAPPLPPDLAAAFADGGRRRLLVVEILNPVELATRKVKAAAMLGSMRPQLLHKIVNEMAVKMVVEQLDEHGVQADVSLHVAR